MSNFARLVGAVVVVFQPDVDGLHQLLLRLKVCSLVVIVKNDSEIVNLPFWSSVRQEMKWVTIIQMPSNVGIATALNEGIDLIKMAGLQYAWTFDQDSMPMLDAGDHLLRHMLSAHATGRRNLAAAVPRIYDLEKDITLPFMMAMQGGAKLGVMQLKETQPIMCAITSGMLINIESTRQIGGMRMDLFIDFVDTEWCFRSNYLGYKIDYVHSAIVEHRLGFSRNIFFGTKKILIKFRSPLRTYYMLRNGWFLSRLAYVPIGWRSYFNRQAFVLIIIALIFGPKRTQQCRKIVKAWVDHRKMFP